MIGLSLRLAGGRKPGRLGRWSETETEENIGEIVKPMGGSGKELAILTGSSQIVERRC